MRTQGTFDIRLELSRGGMEPVQLPDGKTHTFLEGGDTLAPCAWCERDGHARMGFGEHSGSVLPTST